MSDFRIRGGVLIVEGLTGTTNQFLAVDANGKQHLGGDINNFLTSGDTDARYVRKGTLLSPVNETIYGNKLFIGDITLSGTTTYINVQDLNISDNKILLNSGETGAGVTKGEAGIYIDRGTYPDYMIEFVEDIPLLSAGTFRIGQTGSTKAVATRQDVPSTQGVAIWNNNLSIFDTDSKFKYSGTTGLLLNDSLNVTGTTYLNGSATVKNDLVVDGNITGTTIQSTIINNIGLISSLNGSFTTLTGSTIYGGNMTLTGDINTNYISAFGNIDVIGNLNITGVTTMWTGLTVNGDITITGTVDGVDISVLNSAFTYHNHYLTGLTDVNISSPADKQILVYSSALTGYTLTGLNSISSDFWTKAESDSRFLSNSGGTIAGNLIVTGNTSVIGTLIATGATTLYGTTTVDDNLKVTGTLNVTGATTIEGATSLNSTLDVVSNANIVGTLNVTGSTTIQGATNLNSTLAVASNASVIGTLNVTGSTTIEGSTTLYGTTTVDDNLKVTGTLNVTGATTLEGTNTVNGVTTFNNDVYFKNPVTITNNLIVTGNTFLHGNLTVSGTTTYLNVQDLNVSDNMITLNSGETGTGVTNLYSGIKIDRGTSEQYIFVFDEMQDNFRIGMSGTPTGGTQAVATRQDNPIVDGISVWNNSLYIFDTYPSFLFVTGGTNNFNVTGNTNLHGATKVTTGGLNITGTTNIEGTTTINSTLNVTSNADVVGTLKVTGATTIEGATSLNSTLSVTSNANIVGTLKVTGVTTIEGASTVNNNLTVTGSLNVNTVLFVTGTTNTDYLLVSGKTILETIGEVTKEPTGFPNRTDSTISFNNTTKLFTITGNTGSFVYYRNGIKVTKTVNNVTITSSTTHGIFIYFDASDVLIESTSAWNLFTDVPVAYIYWNVLLEDAVVFDERHGITMDAATHQELHDQVGTYTTTGFGISGYETQPITPNNTSNTFGIASGTVCDEDIRILTSALVDDSSQYMVLYRSGSTWAWNENNVTPFRNGTYIYYNQNSGTWIDSELASGDYVNYYVVVTTSLNTNNTYPIIPGQTTYPLLSSALAENIADLDLTNFPFQEVASLYKITFGANTSYTTTGKVRIEAVSRIVGSRITVTSITSSNNHSFLAGLTNDDHLQYALLAGRTGDIYKIDNINEFTSNNGVIVESVTLKDGTIKLLSGATVYGISTATGLTENSNDYLTTQAAVKAYVDSQIGAENYWDRVGSVLSLHNTGDTVNLNTSELNVTGTTTLYGATTVNNSLSVASNASVIGTLNVTGVTTIEGAATLNNTLSVASNTSVIGTLKVTGATTLEGVATLNNTLSVASNETITGTLNVTGATTLEAAATINGIINGSTQTGVYSGNTTIETFAKILRTGCIWHYVVNSGGTNMRAGTIIATWNGSTVAFNETSTTDIGDTTPVNFTIVISGSDLILRSVVASGVWDISTTRLNII